MANTVDNRTWNMKNRNFKAPSTSISSGLPPAHTPMVVDSDQQTAVHRQWGKVSRPGEEWCSKLLNYYRNLHKFPIEIFYFPIPSRRAQLTMTTTTLLDSQARVVRWMNMLKLKNGWGKVKFMDDSMGRIFMIVDKQKPNVHRLLLYYAFPPLNITYNTTHIQVAAR